MTTTTIRDDEAINLFTHTFNDDPDLGWQYWNNTNWQDGHQQRRIITVLIERGVLFGCPDDGCDALSHSAFICDCLEAQSFDEPRDDEDDFCDGCNQPNYACTCAELASWRRHQADPETRGSYWVA